uniref:DUF4777 domain-containing protein n=1 Tax=Glossina palpalis gambiensis TaxID=67801 RepID=A0A1B0BM91_9MUSC
MDSINMPPFKGKFVLDVLGNIGRPANIEEIFEYCCLNHPVVSNYLLNAIKTAIDVGVRHGFVDKIDESYYALTMTLNPNGNRSLSKADGQKRQQ